MTSCYTNPDWDFKYLIITEKQKGKKKSFCGPIGREDLGRSNFQSRSNAENQIKSFIEYRSHSLSSVKSLYLCEVIIAPWLNSQSSSLSEIVDYEEFFLVDKISLYGYGDEWFASETTIEKYTSVVDLEREVCNPPRLTAEHYSISCDYRIGCKSIEKVDLRGSDRK